MAQWIRVHGLGTPVIINADNVATIQMKKNEDGNNALIRFIGEEQFYTVDESFAEVMEMLWRNNG